VSGCQESGLSVTTSAVLEPWGPIINREQLPTVTAQLAPTVPAARNSMPDVAFQMLKVAAWANLTNLRHAERESLGRGGPVKTENSSWLMAIEAPVRLKDMLVGSRRASAVAIAFPQLRLYVKKQKLTCDVLSSTVCNQLYVLPLCHSTSKGPAKGLKAQPEHDS
jgi:hypothetical protein